MYTLEKVTLKLDDKGNVIVIGNDKCFTERYPIRYIRLLDKGFYFTVQANNKQFYIPFENMDTLRVFVPVDKILRTVPDNAECPAFFLYDMLSEYMCYKKRVFINREFSLETIKERHKKAADCWKGINLEAALSHLPL